VADRQPGSFTLQDPRLSSAWRGTSVSWCCFARG
jgi:hypothetical protein